MNHPYANAAGYVYAKTTEWFDTSFDDDESIWDASWSPSGLTEKARHLTNATRYTAGADVSRGKSRPRHHIQRPPLGKHPHAHLDKNTVESVSIRITHPYANAGSGYNSRDHLYPPTPRFGSELDSRESLRETCVQTPSVSKHQKLNRTSVAVESKPLPAIAKDVGKQSSRWHWGLVRIFCI